jgi:hypothetical protein
LLIETDEELVELAMRVNNQTAERILRSGMTVHLANRQFLMTRPIEIGVEGRGEPRERLSFVGLGSVTELRMMEPFRHFRIEGGTEARFESITFTSAFDKNFLGGGSFEIRDGSVVAFADCVWKENKAIGSGGAVRVSRATASFDRCRFESCRADFSGGALAAQNAVIHVRRSVFVDNDSPFGGALYAESSTAVVDACHSDRNRAGWGGAMVGFTVDARVTHTTFSRNDAYSDLDV